MVNEMYMRPNMAFEGHIVVGDRNLAVFRDRFNSDYRVAIDFEN